MTDALRLLHLQGGLVLRTEIRIDGHLVLRSGPNEHRCLAQPMFRGLRCPRIVILTAPVQVLLSRLKARGDETWTTKEIAAFSEAEVQHGKVVAASLGIPAIVLESPDADRLVAAING